MRARDDTSTTGRDRPGWVSRAVGAAGGRRAAWRRRVLRRGGAALAAALAATTALGVLRPASAPAATQLVVVAARAIPAGAVVTAGDLATRAYPVGLAPAGARGSPAAFVGRTVAGPVGRDEVLTAGRLVDTSLLTDLPAGTIALPVTATVESTALLRRGQRVDGFLPGRSVAVVHGALVLAVAADRPDALGGGSAATRVVLAVTGAQASTLFASLDPGSPVTGLTFAAY